MSGSDLDRFMLACSDLNQPARSRLFQNRPGLKDIKVQPRAAAASTAFQTSQKARDWSVLDLGDAFSQPAPPPPPPPTQGGALSDDDFDDFDDFQSCPPPPGGSGARGQPLAGPAGPPPGAPGLQGGPAPLSAMNGTGAGGAPLDPAAPHRPGPPSYPAGASSGSVDLLNGLSMGASGPAGLSQAALGGSGAALNGSAVGHSAPFGYPAAPLSGHTASLSGHPAALSGYTPSPSGHLPPISGHPGSLSGHPSPFGYSLSSHQDPMTGFSATPSTHPASLSDPGALSNGFPPTAGAPSPASGWCGPPAAPPPAAGYTPVPAVLPAAKPTRFRQGLVPRPAEPDEDEFAEFVTAEPAPAARPAAARTLAESRRPGGAGEIARGARPGRLPTVDDSPPPRAASPPGEDLYAALRGLAVAPLANGEVMGAFAPSAAADSVAPMGPTGRGGSAQSLVGLAVATSLTPTPAGGFSGALGSTPGDFSVSLAPAMGDFSTSLAPAMGDFSTSSASTMGDFCTPLAPQNLPPPLITSRLDPSTPEDEDFGEFVSPAPAAPLSEEAPAGALSAVSSRHGSLPSLDLQVAPASEGGEVSPLEPERRDGERPEPGVKEDKYDSFRQEIMSPPSSESALVAEWRRCLQACYELIQEGVALFGSVPSQHTCREVAGSRQGAHYIDNLCRVYRVTGRIQRACEQHGCRHQLDFILSETCKAWANLTAFVANSPTRPSVDTDWSAACEGAAGPTCGVCLLPAGGASDEPTLTCAGRQYHAGCANLWVNRVTDVLPALRP